jgi:transposase InsO family protein
MYHDAEEVMLSGEHSSASIEHSPEMQRETWEISKLSAKEERERIQIFHEQIDTMVSKSECPDNLKAQFKAMLKKHHRVLGQTSNELGYCPLYEPGIPLKTNDVLYTPQYSSPHGMRQEIEKAVKEFKDAGIIRHSTSPFNSPTIMVPKKDGGFRLVVDFRNVNKEVVTDPHPLPRIQQILEEIGGSQYFTALDLLHGFYNLKIRPEDRRKTAFSTPSGHYEFIRLPMGLKNSPSIFQRLMNVVLSGCLGKYAFIYIDDIIVFSKNAESHLHHVDEVLQRLEKAGLRIKFSKSQVFKTEIEYLGFLVAAEGIKVNPRKVMAIEQFPQPKDLKGVQAFLGLVGYFRHFVVQFAELARPLYRLLKKEQEFSWGPEQVEAFQKLKLVMTQAPVLAYPDFRVPFILTTDASKEAVGAILTQKTSKREKLISCSSRVLNKHEQNYPNTDREILAVVSGIHAHRSYLWGHKFLVRTDCSAIPYLARNTSDNPRAIRWYLALAEYDFSIEHRKGRLIAHADALSRYPPRKPYMGPFNAFLSPSHQATDYTPIIDEEMWFKEMEKLGPEACPNDDKFETSPNGLVYYKGADNIKQLWVPPSLRSRVLMTYHDPPAMGHPGVEKMAAAMKKDIYWKGMSSDIKTFVGSCETCQRFKSHNPMIPTEKMPIPSQPFQDVSMDVVGPVPSSSTGYQYVLVIQDRLSRWLTFVPMRNASAETVSRLFLSEWVCQFGAPKRLLTDRGSNFVSHTMKELNSFLGVKHVKTAAYHPQGNGMNERTHRQLHSYLSMFLSPTTRRTWDTMLRYASWVHNSSHHEALQASPFEIVTGLQPMQAKAWLPGNDPTKEALEYTSTYFGVTRDELNSIREQAKEAIAKAQAGYLTRLNVNKKAGKFQVGQKILLRNQDRSTFVSRKWSPKYLGPYVIIQMLSPVTFRAEHLATKKVGIFHAVHAKPYRARAAGKPAVIDQIEQGAVPFVPLMEDDDDAFATRQVSMLPTTPVATTTEVPVESGVESADSDTGTGPEQLEEAEEVEGEDADDNKSSVSSFRYRSFFEQPQSDEDEFLSDDEDNDDSYFFRISPRRNPQPVSYEQISQPSEIDSETAITNTPTRVSTQSQVQTPVRERGRHASEPRSLGRRQAQSWWQRIIGNSPQPATTSNSNSSSPRVESSPRITTPSRTSPADNELLFQSTPVRAPPFPPTIEQPETEAAQAGEDNETTDRGRELKERSRKRRESLDRKKQAEKVLQEEKRKRQEAEQKERAAKRKRTTSTSRK